MIGLHKCFLTFIFLKNKNKNWFLRRDIALLIVQKRKGQRIKIIETFFIASFDQKIVKIT